jgi:hypothetical protein
MTTLKELASDAAILLEHYCQGASDFRQTEAVDFRTTKPDREGSATCDAVHALLAASPADLKRREPDGDANFAGLLGNLWDDVRRNARFAFRQPDDPQKWFTDLNRDCADMATLIRQTYGCPGEILYHPESRLPGLDSAEPKVYLGSWAEILNALKKENTKENRGHVRRLNEQDDGPIIFTGKGTQPKVEREKFIRWWNGLEDRFAERAARERDRAATISDQYNFGRDAIVTPEISGSVKRRRKST